MTAEARAATAAGLRAEAQELLDASGMFALLERRFGRAVVTGSAGYDLMVWRDIDIHMPVEATRWRDWAVFGGELAACLDAAGLQLHRATYWNDYVQPDPLGAGLYWGIEFRDAADNPWKCDLWGWDPPDFARREARDKELREKLAAADRDLILRLKTEARNRPGYYGVIAGSWDIYQFAIAQAGDTLEQLEAWKKAAK